jgi:hypothetical protein
MVAWTCLIRCALCLGGDPLPPCFFCLRFDIDLGVRGTFALGCVTASALCCSGAEAPSRQRAGHGHSYSDVCAQV